MEKESLPLPPPTKSTSSVKSDSKRSKNKESKRGTKKVGKSTSNLAKDSHVIERTLSDAFREFQEEYGSTHDGSREVDKDLDKSLSYYTFADGRKTHKTVAFASGGLDKPYKRELSISKKREVLFKPMQYSISKKVHVPWYRRYASACPDNEWTLFQPSAEVANDEMSIAMGQRFGLDFRRTYAKELSDDQTRAEMERTAMNRYIKSKSTTSPKEKLEDVDSNQTKKVDEISLHLKRLQRKQKLWGAPVESKWTIFKTPKARLFFKIEYYRIRRECARKRFIKSVNVVMCVNHFKHVLTADHASLNLMISELSELSDVDETVKAGQFKTDRKKDMLCLPSNVVLSLTKPWYTRTVTEIGEIVKNLYSRWVYHKYPIKVQMQIATVAWYTRLYKLRPIARDGNPATNFVHVLSGQIAITEYIEDKPKVVRFFNKGERFGDERMDTIERKRFFNAYTTTGCEILSIDYNEYQKSLLVYDSRYDNAPFHINFISRLPLFSTIPITDLLQSADTSIQLFYFCHESVISTSLRNSDFIFIVILGECHTAVIQKSHRKKASYKPKVTERVKVVSQKWTSARKARRAMHERAEITSSHFAKSKMAQDFAKQIKRISKSSLGVSKEETIKRIQGLRIVRVVGGVYGNECVRRVAEELVDKMYVHETLCREYEEEIKKVRIKTIRLQRKLQLARQQVQSMSLVKSLIDKKNITRKKDQDRPVVDKGTETPKDKQSASQIYVGKSKSELGAKGQTSKKTPQERIARQQGATPSDGVLKLDKNKSTIDGMKEDINSFMTKENTDQKIRPESVADVKVATFDIGSTSNDNPSRKTPGGEKSPSFTDTVPSERASLSRQNSKELTFSNDQESTGKCSVTSEAGQSPSRASSTDGNADGNNQEFEEIKRSSKDLTASASEEKSTPEELIRKSVLIDHVFKHVAMYSKGDIIGNEFIDYNDGRYREPETDLHLISDGVECVMVTKAFLLSRLYNHQKSYSNLLDKFESSDSDEGKGNNKS